MITWSRGLLATAAAAVSALALAGCAAGSPGVGRITRRQRIGRLHASLPGSPKVNATPAASPSMSINPGGPMARASGPAAAECTTAQLKVAYTR